MLASFPEVRYIVDQEGMPDDGSDVNGWDITEYSVGLIPRERWTTAHDREALCDAMARKLRESPALTRSSANISRTTWTKPSPA